MKEKSTELEWLRWFYQTVDFGPADWDIRLDLKRQFIDETGKALPDGYSINDYGYEEDEDEE